jgi:Mrp family chromosome partitioning ATPase
MAELRAAFFSQADEILDNLPSCIMALEENADEESWKVLKRAFHTLKGDSKAMGFDSLSAFAHKVEDLIAVLKNGDVEKGSINLLLESEDQAVIWRGPLISKTIQQFWSDVFWGDLDYLLVDLPPGTSDASLTVLQSLPMSGVVLVTSPQNLAAMVVRKAAQMVRHVEIPILGLVENMSYFVCPDTGAHHRIFGPSDPAGMARQLHMPFLGCLPIDPEIVSLCDRGEIENYPGKLFDSVSQRIVELAPAADEPKMAK